MMYFLYEQEWWWEVIRYKWLNEIQIEEIFQEEKQKVIEYLDTNLAKLRFYKNIWNWTKDWSTEKEKIKKNINLIKFEIWTTRKESVLWSFYYDYNKILLSANLSNDSNYSEQYIRNIIYHELMHATLLYREDITSLTSKLDLEGLQWNILDHLISEDEVNIIPQLELEQLFDIKEDIESDLDEIRKKMSDSNWEIIKILKDDEFSKEDKIVLINEINFTIESYKRRIALLEDKMSRICKFLDNHASSIIEKQNGNRKNLGIAQYLGNQVELYPRLKLIQNFLFEKYDGNFSEENLKYFFQQVDNYQNSKQESEDFKNADEYFSDKIDEWHLYDFYLIFIVWLKVLEPSWLSNLLSVINILDTLVDVGDAKKADNAW